MAEPVNSAEFGLDDPGILEEATQLAPDLFAALAICRRVSPTFPLESDTQLEELLAEVLNDGDAFTWQQFRIRPRDARELFPNEFLPVTDARDLIRKVYLSVLRAHDAQSRRTRQRLRSGQLDFNPSHPLPEDD